MSLTSLEAGGRVSRRVLSSSWLGVVLLGLLVACGSRTKRNPVDNGAAAEFCDDLASKLEACGFMGLLSIAQCRQIAGSASSDTLDRARACLDGSCDDLAICVNGELGSIIPNGAGGGSGGTGSGGGGSTLTCPGSPVRCLDEATAEYCDGATPQTVICADAMAQQGIVSNGCSSDARGDGCTVDAFTDPECEAGAPVFAVCEGLSEEDLVKTYTACFQHVSGASDVIPCYQDFVDATGVTVDCPAAQVSCAVAQ
jgi:hypothetical protein